MERLSELPVGKSGAGIAAKGIALHRQLAQTDRARCALPTPLMFAKRAPMPRTDSCRLANDEAFAGRSL